MVPRKVIIDTDVGVDDAVALYLALAAHLDPNDPFEIIGITTSIGNTDVDHVCQNVFIVLSSVGANDIPVYKGAASPIVHPFVRGVREPPIFGNDGFGDVDLSKLNEIVTVKRDHSHLEAEYAPLALVRLAREYKGELTVVALGPLTNLAIAINIDPEFSTNVKELYVMGGNIHSVGNIRPCVEFNFFVDPESAFVTLQAPWNEKIVIVPLEACKLAMSTLDWRRDVMGSIKSKQVELLNLVEEKLLSRYKEQYGVWVSPDAVCMAALLKPDIVTRKSTNYCTVELQGSWTRGQMVVDHPQRTGIEHNATIIEQISITELEDMLTSMFKSSIFPQDV